MNSTSTYIALVFALVSFFSCTNEIEEIDAATSEVDFNVEEAKDVFIQYTDSAILRLTIKAPVLLNHIDPSNPRNEFPEGVEVTFFDQYGNFKSKLTSKYAIQDNGKRQTTVRDSVVLKDTEDRYLEAEELLWDEGKATISSPKDKLVRITTNNEVLQGYGFNSDASFKEWTLDSISGQFSSETLN